MSRLSAVARKSWLLLPVVLFSAAALAQPILPENVVRDVTRILESADDDPRGAIDALTDLLERRRRAPDVQAYIAQQKAALQMREDQLQEARDTLLAVFEGQPTDFALPLRLMLGQALLMLDDYTAGLAQLRIWAETVDKPDPNGLFLLGYAYLRVDDLEQGIAYLENAMAALEIAPRNHWIELLAYAYARAGRAEDALDLMVDLLTRDPGQERWWRQLASVLLVMDDIPRGAAALAIAEQVKPGTFEQRRRLARFLAHMGVPLAGAETLAAAVADHPQEMSIDDQLLLAEMWVLAREFDAAVAALEKAQLELPGDGKPSLILGQMYLHWERYEEARAALEQAVRAYGEETPAQLYYLLAITHINLRQLDRARQALVYLEDDDEYAGKGAQLERFIASRQAAARS